MGNETSFKEKIRPALESLPNTVVFKIQQVTINGTPDFILSVNGLFVALELKRDEKAPVSPLQRHYLERIVSTGGVALLVYPSNWEEMYTHLKQLAYQNSNYEEPRIN